jgi:hypothetical protein
MVEGSVLLWSENILGIVSVGIFPAKWAEISLQGTVQPIE